MNRPALIVAILLAARAPAAAHVIPTDARIQAFIKPEGSVLRMLVRVPLEAMVDIPYPTRGNGELVDLDRVEPTLRELTALWLTSNIAIYENGVQLPDSRVVDVRAALAFDGSFASYDQALAHVHAPPLTNVVDFVWNQGLLDVLLEYPIGSPQSRFSIRSTLATLAVRTTTSLHFLARPGVTRVFEYVGDPGYIALEPGWRDAFVRFVRSGFREVLRGAEYWLFLLVLVLPLGGVAALVPAAAAVVVASAITISPSSSFAVDALWFQPLVAFVIAAFAVYLAIENGIGSGTSRRWRLAFAGGLVLGFQLSFPLRDTLQFGGDRQMAALAAYGFGADLATVVVLGLVAVATQLVLALVGARPGAIILSLMTGDIAWHWLLADFDIIRRYQLQWPSTPSALMLVVVSWATNAVIAAAVFWLLVTVVRRFSADAYRPVDAIAPVHAESGTSIQ